MIAVGKEFKNRRRTLHRQILSINQRLADLEAGRGRYAHMCNISMVQVYVFTMMIY